MKQLFIILVLTAVAISAGAKIIVTNADNAGNEHGNRKNTLFCNTKIDVSKNKIVFDQLPNKATEYYVLDATGHAKL